MNFVNDTGLQQITNKLVQGDAIKVASHRGHTVKNVIDNITRECENVSTPNTITLENRVNEFRVGKGGDIDVSGDVEEGKIEVELQGKTWQNIFVDVVSIGGSESALVTNIDKNNLSFEVEFLDEITSNRSANRVKILSNLRDLLKPNTTYTFIYKYTLLENPFNEICQLGIAIDMWGSSYCNSRGVKEVGYSGISITRWTTNEQVDKYSKHTCFFNQLGRNSKWKVEGLIVLEGDHTYLSEDESPKYFQGIKSSFEDGVVDVEVQGKNLFIIRDNDYTRGELNVKFNYLEQTITLNGTPPESEIYFYISNGYQFYDVDIRDGTSNKKMSLKLELIGGSYDLRNSIRGRIGHIGSIGTLNKPIMNLNDFYIFDVKTKPDKMWIRFDAGVKFSNCKFRLMMTEVVTETPYEPYYKKKISFNIGEPLRSLPNGVCDEIRNNNGQWELVRRVRKTVLDETFDYTLWGNTPSDGYFVCHANSYLQGGNFTFSERLKNVICDKLPVSTQTGAFRNMSFFKTNPHITVSSSEANSIPEFKEWIAKNPITLYYELVNPVITQIEPIEFEVKPLATVTINSEITPVSNHTVVLNRAGQIEQGIVEIAELRKRVVDLETVYESRLLETQLKLSLLTLDHELEKEEI